jgi:hypothetical protein
VALGYFPEQTARLLEVPQADSENPAPDQSSISGSWLFGPAKESTASTSGLFFLDNRQIADALEAWLNYGLEQAKANGLTLDMKIPADSNDLNLNESELRETWSRAIAFYRVFEGYSSRTYHQDNTRVRHFLLKFSDR